MCLRVSCRLLSANHLSDKDAKAFAEALKENRTLTHLDLSHNEIGEMGGIYLGAGLVRDLKQRSKSKFSIFNVTRHLLFVVKEFERILFCIKTFLFLGRTLFLQSPAGGPWRHTLALGQLANLICF